MSKHGHPADGFSAVDIADSRRWERMAGFMLRRPNHRRPINPLSAAVGHLIISILLLLIALMFADVTVPAFQASIGDGTLGTYTVTGITAGKERHPDGTFISANRQTVIKNIGYTGNSRLDVGATVKAIEPSWSWLLIGGGSVYATGLDTSTSVATAFNGLMLLAGLIYVPWSIRTLKRRLPGAVKGVTETGR